LRRGDSNEQEPDRRSVKDAAGKIQKKVGEATGNTYQQVKGTAKQIGGKVQKDMGYVEQAFDDSAKRSCDKR
jgi:uncharacterized protein YjbJ (UPF0337 family)